MGEKEILVFWIEAATSMSRWLAMPLKTATVELKHHKYFEQFSDYFQNVIVPIQKGANPYM